MRCQQMISVAGFLLVLLQTSGTLGQTSFTVNTAADSPDTAPGDGLCDGDAGTPGDQCTLRAAIQEANASPESDTIQFDAALNGIPITLTISNVGGDENGSATGDLDITQSLTITGNGAENTIIEGVPATWSDRILDVGSGGSGLATVAISGVTIRNGRSTGLGGGVRIASATLVTIADSVISDNQASQGGGIHHNSSGLFLDRVTVAGNTADDGGGMYGDGFGLTFSITNSTFSDNTATAVGTGAGGAIWLSTGRLGFDAPTVLNSTLSGNKATNGCAAAVFGGKLSLRHVTVANNCTAGTAQSAVRVTFGPEWEGIAELDSTVLESPVGVVNCATDRAAIQSEGYNLSSDASCGLSAAGDVENTNPILGPLADNGGPTRTHRPLPGSLAIDTASPACAPPPTDQRGSGRPADGDLDGTAVCDKGSVEVAAGGPGPSTGVIQGVKWDDANGDQVRQTSEAGVAGVQICLFPTTPTLCGLTDANGAYQLPNVAPGTYQVYERLPAGRFNTTPRSRQVDVLAGQTVTSDFGNMVPAPPPPPVQINTTWQTWGVPTTDAQRPLRVRVTGGCVAASATATINFPARPHGIPATSRTQAMTNMGNNTFETTFAPPFDGPISGITVILNCANGGTQFYDGNVIFIDPSGTILDQCTGGPLAGATVSLLKNEPYGTAVYLTPDASEHIPSNNPEVTEADGLYAWDVVPGRWRVTASKPGYTTVTTDAFDVPPPKLGLDITLTPIAGCPPPNAPPVALDDQYRTRKNKILVVRAPGVLTNDTDPEGAALTAHLVRRPVHGRVLLLPNGSFIYWPKRGFTGSDTFTYQARDAVNLSNEAIVTIDVTKKGERDKDDDDDEDDDEGDDDDRDAGKENERGRRRKG